MVRRPRPLATTVAAAGLLLAASAAAPGPAQAAALAEPGLYLTISGSGQTWTRAVLLACPAHESAHPHAVEACALIERANGDLDALSTGPRPCTREYRAVNVGASGNWLGRQVAWHRTFPNPCTLDAATGPVFRF